MPNLPTEEIFTSPDRRRAEGTLRSTRPLQLAGTVIRDLQLEFHDGRIVEVRASGGADVVRVEPATDENATSHVAYGGGFAFCVDDETDREERLNLSAAHTDFMVGDPEFEIDAKEQGGAWIPLLRDDQFQIG